MSQDIILKAVLDQTTLDKQIDSLGTSISNRLDNLGFSKNILGNQFKNAISDAQELEKQLDVSRSKGFFGDKAGINSSIDGMNALIKKQKEMKVLSESLYTSYNKLQTEMTKANTTLPDKLKSTIGSMSSYSLQNILATGDYTGLAKTSLGFDPKAQKQVEDYLQTLLQFRQVKGEVLETSKAFNALDGHIAKLKATSSASLNPLLNMLHNFGIEGDTVGQVFGRLAGKVITWSIATTGIFAIIGAFRFLATEMKALQDAQVALRQVLPGIGKELDAQTEATMRFAKEMNKLTGASFVDSITAVKESVRAGFNFQDSLKITEAALLGVNIAELTASDASKYLTSTIMQFGLTSNDAIDILNQWNELSQRIGANTGQIAEGVVRSAQAWKLAGGSLSQLSAVVTALSKVTGQSGEKIGTMLKTLSARYADVNSRGSLAKTIDDLGGKGKGINIFSNDQKTMFKDIYDVLGELAGRWSTLNDVTQASIAKAAVGVRQYSLFIAVMTNWSDVMHALIVDIDSNNSALSENERRTKSLDFAMQNFHGTVSTLATSKGAQVFLATLTISLNLLTIAIDSLTSPLFIFGSLIAGLIFKFATLTKTFTSFQVVEYICMATTEKFKIQIQALDNAIKFLQANPMLFWIAAIGTGLALLSLAQNKSVTDSANLTRQMIEETNAMYNRREALQQNAKAIEAYYKTANSQGRKDVEDMFKDIANIKFDGTNKNIEDLITKLNSLGNTVDTAMKQKKYGILDNLNPFGGLTGDIESVHKILHGLGVDLSKDAKEGILQYSYAIDKLPNRFKALKEALLSLKSEALNKKINMAKEESDSDNKTLIDLVKRRYQREYDIKKGFYDAELTYYRKIMGGVIDSLLGNEGSISDRLIGATKSIGTNIFKQLTDQLGNTLGKTLYGKVEPTNWSDKIELVMKDGSEVMKNNLLTAMQAGSASIKDAADYLQYQMDGIWSTDGGMAVSAGQNVATDIVKSFYYGSQIEKKPALSSALTKATGYDSEGKATGSIWQHGFLFGKTSEWKRKIINDPVYSQLFTAFGENTGTGYGNIQDTMVSSKTREAFKSKLKTYFSDLDSQIKDVLGDVGNKLDKKDFNVEFLQKFIDPINKWFDGLIHINKNVGGKIVQINTALGDQIKFITEGIGLGSVGAGMAGKGTSMSSSLGGMLGYLTPLGPWGALAGGLLGSLFDNSNQQDPVQEDQAKYARESFKELKQVNRNLTILVDNSKPFQINDESYYFATSKTRGLTSV